MELDDILRGKKYAIPPEILCNLGVLRISDAESQKFKVSNDEFTEKMQKAQSILLEALELVNEQMVEMTDG